MSRTVLLVDDDQAMLDLMTDGLSRQGFACVACNSAERALEELRTRDFDAVVTDVRMRRADGIELCQRITAENPEMPVVVITAFGSLETAVAALRAGAYDFITKPLELAVLVLTLERAAQHRALQREVHRLREQTAAFQPSADILGDSPPMQRLFAWIERVARTDSSVLLTGETGTGKELVAHAIHDRSERRAGPFVAVDCAAVPGPLLESELFGHVRGAYTDAKGPRTGLFVQASGGSLLLDEIGNLPADLQPKLMRVLQERRLRPVGGTDEIPFDVRLISATNRDLEAEVEAERFRQDLLFRLDVVHIDLPPLRARGNDVLMLAQHFLTAFARKVPKPVDGLSPQAAERLLNYTWPGNVRELQNCMERAVALTQQRQLSVADLPEKIRTYQRSYLLMAGDDPSELLPLATVERGYILKVLEAVGGNKAQAARILGLDRKTLYRKLERWGQPEGTEDTPAS